MRTNGGRRAAFVRLRGIAWGGLTYRYICEGTGIHMCTKSGTTICTVCILSCEIKNDFMHNVPWYSISVFYLLLNFLYFITFGRR